MKNFTKKLISGIIFSIFTTGLLPISTIAYAEDPVMPSPQANASNGESAKNNPLGEADCVDPKGTDKGYIITILEEAFETEKGAEDPKASYKTRICYRNNYQIKQISTGQITTYSELYKECSSGAKEKAQNPPAGYEIRFGCKEVLVVLSKGGTTMIYGYIGMIYRWGARLVGIIAVLIIVLSGMQLAASGGDQEVIGSAKKRIIQSLSGIAVLFLSSLILNTINPTFYIISP